MPTSPGPALELSGVSKSYGPNLALDRISLQAASGEILALLGPNGAGKSTLIHCITGLARQSAGEIRVFGRDTRRDYRFTRRQVGLVPQEINFDPFFTPLETLLNQMGYMGVAPDPVRARKLLETFALADKAHAPTRSLSGGMKRRLLVAKALVHAPALIFLDEPTAGVDVELRRELWDEVRALRARGATVILTTHYLEEAEQLADRIGVLHQGRLLLVQERETLMRSHRKSRVRIEMDRPIDQLPPGLPPDTRQPGPKLLEAPWSEADELGRLLAAFEGIATVVDLRFHQTRLEDVFVDLSVRQGRIDRVG